jgi:hypothetical protein
MCNSIMYKKYISQLKYFIARNANHYLSFQRGVIFLLMEGLASMLVASDWPGRWLLKVAVAVAVS